MVGLYNRSVSNHTEIFEEGNNSTESFSFAAGPRPVQDGGHLQPCFSRNITAAAGHVTRDVSRVRDVAPDGWQPCSLPGGTWRCGAMWQPCDPMWRPDVAILFINTRRGPSTNPMLPES